MYYEPKVWQVHQGILSNLNSPDSQQKWSQDQSIIFTHAYMAHVNRLALQLQCKCSTKIINLADNTTNINLGYDQTPQEFTQSWDLLMRFMDNEKLFPTDQ